MGRFGERMTCGVSKVRLMAGHVLMLRTGKHSRQSRLSFKDTLNL